MSFRLGRRVSEFIAQAKQLQTQDLPILPVNTVLFPGGLLHLKIVEPSISSLIGHCLKQEIPLGVSLMLQDGAVENPYPESVGCIARITDWGRTDEGGLQISVAGEQRYFAESMAHEKNGMIIGQAVPIAKEPDLPLPPKHMICAEILKRLVAHLGEDRFIRPLAFEDAVWVSYRLAELLPLKRTARQNMLEMNDTLTRIEILHGFLAQQGLQA